MIKLYNTLVRKKQEFVPIKKNKASIYSCGPTVYDYAHIGNFRAYVFADLLKRVLQFNGFKVKHVINITDVGHLTSDDDEGEDKLEKAARTKGKTAWQIADIYSKAFWEDFKKLNLEQPDIWAKATDHIAEQINLVKILEKKGFTYKTSDGIYFDTSKFKDYGKLGKIDLKGLEEGARVQKNPEKRNATDFALWKFSPKDAQRQMEWESPWGVGFPGWHLECSAMSMKYLGEHFDIHTGGIDHINIHHNNEIAESEAATGQPLANYWLHSEHITIENEKMSKSLGNVYTLTDLQEKGFESLDYRYLLMQTHYRTRMNFTWDALAAAKKARLKLSEFVLDNKKAKKGLPSFEKKFSSAINDDLNLPKALGIIWDMVRSPEEPGEIKTSLLKFDSILGLNLDLLKRVAVVIPTQVQDLAKQRQEARKEKKWDLADEIRKQIEDLGYEVKDTDKGYEIKEKTIA